MSTFDSGLKRTQQYYARDLVPFVATLMGLEATTHFIPLDTALPATGYQSDGRFRIDTTVSMLLHLEYESSHRLNRAKRFLRYNVLASEREGIDAHTVVILLRPQANSTDLISPYQQHLSTGLQNITFTFDSIRIWEYPPATFLSGGPGLWSLASLADVTPAELPNVMTELKVRWDTLPQPSAIDLANLTQLFMGLRYTKDTIRQLFRGFSGMEESVIYQEIEQIGIAKGEQIGIAKGEQIGITKGESNGKVQMGQVALISVLEGKFGYVEPATQSAISAITDIDRLARMLKGLHQVTNAEAILTIQ